MLIGFFIITAIILIKYKPVYKVSMSGQKIGYSNSKEDIYTYIDKIVNNKEENVAFVVLEEEPEFKLQLANRNTQTTEEKIKNKIYSKIEIQYTSYAITYNKKNIAYVANKEEAEQLVEDIKKDYSNTYTKKIGMLQVYSEDYEDIKAINKEDATTNLSKLIKKEQKQDKAKTAVKVASKKTTSTTVKRSSSANGVKFSVKPVSGTITSRYGYRSSPGGIGSTNHKGLDIAASCGTPIYAAAAGTVEFSGTKGSLGKLIIINHGKGIKTYYAHCNSLKVSSGQKVEAGTNIATVGKSGTATGYHLHFEVRINGTSVNPQKYIY